MIATASGGMLAGVTEAEPQRIWFGRGGCVERHDDGRYAVFVRGELLGVYSAGDVASRDVLIAVVAEQGEREDVARAFRVSQATVGRAITRYRTGGFRAVADYGGKGGRSVRTEKLEKRLAVLFEEGLGPRAAHRAVARLASYGTVQAMHARWLAERASASAAPLPMPQQLPLAAANESDQGEEAASAVEAVAPAPATTVVEIEHTVSAPVLEAVLPPAQAIVQHVGSWLLLGVMNALGVYEIAARCAGKAVELPTLRAAMDTVSIALAIGEGCVEGVRRLETPSVGVLVRHAGGISASWARRVLHEFADVDPAMFQGAVASRLLRRTADGADRVVLYVDNHLRPYTGQHVIRKGWRMQDKRAVAGTTDYYVHDEDGCPLWRVSAPAHDSLCAWLGPAVEFAQLSLGEEVTPLLVFDRGGAYPKTMAELRDAEAEFVTYERKPYPELGATEFKQSLTITLASRPHKPTRICYTEPAQKNLRSGRGRVRRIALLTEEGAQLNLLAVSTLPAETLIRAHLARWGLQENKLKHQVERWGINHLDGRRVEEYPADAIIPNPARRRLERVLKLSHTAEGEAWRAFMRAAPDDPDRAQFERDARAAMERQRDLMAQRADVPKMAKVSETPLAGKLRRHELGYKNVLDTLRTALANAEADLAVLLAAHLDRPREVKKLLGNLFTAPGVVRVGSRAVTVRLMPAASDGERDAFRAFLRDVTRLRLSLPGDPDRRRLRWVLK